MSNEFLKNKYYQLKTVGDEAVSVAETLLKQYPLTQMLLEILGRYLLEQIQFGIFSPGTEIIVQGAKGKDLYLICNHQADVLVHTKRILHLQTPVLVGVKGIFDKGSVRNATILISADGDSLVIKVPMELFIRSFKKENIADKEFIQEKRIFFHLFREVQDRLFKYNQIQKNLWEEISNSLHSLNIQLIVGSLNRKDEKEWGNKFWEVIMKFLHSTIKVTWPEQLPYGVKNLVDFLQKILDKKQPRSTFKGTDEQYAFNRQKIWKSWLYGLSEKLVKGLPADQLPISIGEIELFNPQIYQMRMSSFLQSVERKFMLKKVKTQADNRNPALLKAGQFFGRDVKKYEFNLNAYTKAINKQFVFKNPNRVMAQLTQQIAQLTATCENEFNQSVSKMQHFLEKIRSLSSFENDKKDLSQFDDAAFRDCISTINQGFKAYKQKTVRLSHVHIGEVRFEKTESPNIGALIKSCGTDILQKKVGRANSMLLRMLRLSGEYLSEVEIGNLLHFCECFPADIISPNQLSGHYWIPISPGISLRRKGILFAEIHSGTLIGGKSWDPSEGGNGDSESSWNLSIPKEKVDATQTYLIGVIPLAKLPWNINSSPLPDEFEKKHLPVIQWLIVQHVSNLVVMEQLRDLFFERYARISEVVMTEKKVREFENDKTVVSEQNYNKIRILVMETVGLNLGKDPRLSSELLSKNIYNRILDQTKNGFPNLKIEEQGNKAYTLWRYVQSQIVKEVHIKGADPIKLDPPDSIFEMIDLVIEKELKKLAIPGDPKGLDMLAAPPEIDLKKILQGENELLPKEKLEFALEILQLVENYVVMLTEETNGYQNRLQEISSIKTEFDFKELQNKFISESVEKLQKILSKKLRSESLNQHETI
ncbi:MAG: hypothetical protein HQ517_06920 [SAR324 cluster bacterium]|nr:hypothetical protein [SAR324 cluster bacterium]